MQNFLFFRGGGGGGELPKERETELQKNQWAKAEAWLQSKGVEIIEAERNQSFRIKWYSLLCFVGTLFEPDLWVWITELWPVDMRCDGDNSSFHSRPEPTRNFIAIWAKTSIPVQGQRN